MAHHLFHCIGFVVDGEAIDHCRAGFVQPDDVDFRSLTTELDDDFVQRADGGQVQKWARLTSIRTLSITSLKSKELTKRPAEAKNTCPVT